MASHAPFAVLDRTGNPLVRTILRSPAHGLLSGRLLLITVTGTRSGDQFTFPVGYRQDGDRVTIVVGWPERKRWWRNLRQASPVRLLLRGTERTGRAQAHGGERAGIEVEVELDPRA